MTIIASALIQATEQNHRNQSSAMLSPSGSSALGVQVGVQSGLDITKSGMGATISVGRAVCPHPVGPEQGVYTLTVTASESVTFADGDVSRNRIDLVVLGMVSNAPKVYIVQGLYPVSGNPVPPTTPAGAIPLWKVPIASGTTSATGGWNFAGKVDYRLSYAAKGGRTNVASQAQRDALYKYDGISVWRLDNNTQENYNKATNAWDVVPVKSDTDRLPRGVIAMAQYNQTTSAIEAMTIVMNIPSVTFKANRLYKVSWGINFYVSGINSTFVFGVASCSVNDAPAATSGLTDIRAISDRPTTSQEGRAFYIQNPVSYTVDTTLQIKAYAQRANGSDGLFITGNPGNPGTLLVEDIGASL